MSSEGNIMRRIMLALGKRPDVRLFRNNVGVAVFPDGSRVAYGLAPGSSDIIGWKSVEVSRDMVGQRLAVFVAVEVKGERGRLTEHQLRFIDTVRQFGGIAGVATSPEEALKLLNNTPTTTDKGA